MTEETHRDEEPQQEEPPKRVVFVPEIRPAAEPVCCGSGCPGCPYFA